MGSRHRRGLILAAGAAASFLVATRAPEPFSVLAAPPRPVILGARADRVAGTLTVLGRGFAGGGSPEVTLGGVALAVSTVTEDTIVAELPPDVLPGSLLLTVALGNRSDSFAATIPATDIVTPDGITIRSTASDVQVLAGGSRIFVDPAGGIRIESTGAIELRAGTNLDLRAGNAVTIAAGSSLRLTAPTIDVAGAATTNISGGARVAVTGGLVTLN